MRILYFQCKTVIDITSVSALVLAVWVLVTPTLSAMSGTFCDISSSQGVF
jgi:hypothetical protein